MLAPGQHTLTNQPDGDESSKICVLVKLTDSSMKAIEEFLKNKVVFFIVLAKIENLK